MKSNLPTTILFAAFSSKKTDFAFERDHDTLRVKNLEVSADFYQNILGLKEIPNGGLPNHIRWFQLNDRVQIHLVESAEEVQRIKGVHMAMNTRKLEEFMDFLKKKEVHFENWEGTRYATNTRPDGVKQIYLQDPDGYWIEVNDNKL